MGTFGRGKMNVESGKGEASGCGGTQSGSRGGTTESSRAVSILADGSKLDARYLLHAQSIFLDMFGDPATNPKRTNGECFAFTLGTSESAREASPAGRRCGVASLKSATSRRRFIAPALTQIWRVRSISLGCFGFLRGEGN